MITDGATISVIVPGLDVATTVTRCLHALAGSRVAPDELLFFDDGSSDGSGAIAAACGARVLSNHGAPIGPGMARNRAAAASGCDLLLFVDADVAIHPDALGFLRGALTADHVAAFGSYDDAPPAPGIASRYANLRHHFVHQQGGGEAHSFWAGLGLIRRDAFLAAGGFSAAYTRPSIEDIELGARLIGGGGRICLVPEAQATHLKQWSVGRLWRTDILQRAIPWSRLIAAGRSSADSLNASSSETWAALWAWLIAAGLIAACVWPWALAGVVPIAIAYARRNRRFFAFLMTRMSAREFAGAVALHWSYHLYASAILGVALLAVRIRSQS